MLSDLSPSSRRFESWKEIAAFFGRSVRTVQRWERSEGMPVHRHDHDKRGTAFAYESELAAWLASRRPAAPPNGSQQRWSGSRRFWIITALLAAGAVGTFRMVANHRATSSNPGPLALGNLKPIFTGRGRVLQPAMSPDGKRLAFSWTGDADDNYDVYVSDLASGHRQRLTSYPHFDGGPVWSSDGARIAFTRNYARGRNGVYIMNSSGGEPRMVADGFTAGPQSWLPDGRSLIVSQRDDPRAPLRLRILDLNTGKAQPLVPRSEESLGDVEAAVSPDGSRVVFVREHGDVKRDLYLVSLNGHRNPIRLTQDRAAIWGHTWTVDGRQIIFSSNRSGEQRLWTLDLETLEAKMLPFGEDGFAPVAAREGSAVAYCRISYDLDVWSIALPGANLRRVISTSRWDWEAAYSPDGSRVAYTSDSSGTREIWVSTADGSDKQQITSLGGASMPAWSQDSRSIAFRGANGASSQIFTVPATGGPAQRLTRGPGERSSPSWSADSRWIYFDWRREEGTDIWKTAAEGGEPVRLTFRGGENPQSSRDGRWLYYQQSGSLRQQSLIDGADSSLGVSVEGRAFAVGAHGVYYQPPEVPKPGRVLFLSPGSVPKVLFGMPLASGRDRLSVSPDDRTLMFSQLEVHRSELIVLSP